jgi:hypothetical protein
MILGQGNQDEQRPSLFQRIGNFFGEDDPNAGSPIDPFANLTRAQRTMLGFSALRDAAASLEGRDSNFFAQSLGGFEQARERERLRAQGEMQNRVGALQALATLNEQMRYNQAFGLPTDPATDALRAALMEAAGLGSGAAPMAGGMPSMPTAGMPATRLPTGPAVMDASGAIVGDIGDEPLSPTAQAALAAGPDVAAPVPAPLAAPAAPSNRISQIDANIAELTRSMTPRIAAGAGVADLQAMIDMLTAERQRLVAGEAAEVTAQEVRLAGEDEARQANYYGNLIGSVINDPALEGVVGRIQGRVDPAGIAGAAMFNENEMDVLSRLDQLGGAAFLQAFESLKGGGQITEIEGLKATQAISRLGQRAVSPQAFRGALRELQQIYANAEARARGQDIPFPEINVEAGRPSAPTISQDDEDILRRYLP